MFIASLLLDANYGHMDWSDGGWMVFWGPVVMLGFVVLVGLLFRFAVNDQKSRDIENSENRLNNARKILAERYARGELDSEEYQERLKFLH